MSKTYGMAQGGITVSAAALVVCGMLACAKAAEPKRTESQAALAATGNGEDMTAEVKREGGKVWIEGVPDIKINAAKEEKHFGWTKMLRGIHLMLVHRGEKTSLNEVMAYSGDAFNLCHGAKWELRTGHSIPTGTLVNVAAVYGYAGRWTPPRWTPSLLKKTAGEKRRATGEYLSQLFAEIDAGRPVLFGGVYGRCASWRVLVGYDSDQEQVCYVGGENPFTWTELWDKKAKEWGFWDMQVRGTIRGDEFLGGWQANAAFLLGERTVLVPEAQRVRSALRRAAELHRAEPRSVDWYGGVTYYFGEKAYQEWAKDLRELDYPADLMKKRPKVPEIYDMSMLIYQTSQIVEGRTAAAEFCESVANVLPNAKNHLAAAAKAYREEVEIAREAFGAFLQTGDNDGTGRKAWLSDGAKREAGADAILRMLEKDRAAIGEIEHALAAEGEK